jgi:hypothetical protein
MLRNWTLRRFPPWYGELGWEVMTWVPWCRKQAQQYNEVIVSSFAGMAALYGDFATRFEPHQRSSRSLDYPKMYRPDGIYRRYGRRDAGRVADILIHARGIHRKAGINYPRWPEVTALLSQLRIPNSGSDPAQGARPLEIAFIGTHADARISGYKDLRNIKLLKLMDVMACAQLTIGASSGVMHLAAACGCDVVVWGDERTYFGETLEQRYTQTWNPFGVRVGWITAHNWQPEPARIVQQVDAMLPHGWRPDYADRAAQYPADAGR